MWWYAVIELVICFAGVFGACRYWLHMLQLESYQLDGYGKFLMKNVSKLTDWKIRCAGAVFAIDIILPIIWTLVFSGDRAGALVPVRIVLWVVFASYAGVNIWSEFRTPQKKALVFTKRMKRLTGGLAGVIAVLELIWLLILGHENAKGYRVMYITPLVLVAAAPFIVYLAGIIMQPVENAINHKYYVAAQQKLAAKKDVIKIGITGSYGKTSTKHALASILSVKYKVLKSPASINTPMGLSALINNKFPEDTEIFIAEMGARHTQDIKELVELIHPTLGLITSIGPQHLDTFGSIDAIANTKFDLVRGLPKGGCAFFASDNDWVDRMYKKATCEKYLTGVADGELNGECGLTAEDIAYGPEGLSFTLREKDGDSVRCECKLLGRHNISNIVLCCAVARKLGLTLPEIAEGVSRIESVEHRLQVIPGYMTVIDDTFNSNPRGSIAAVDVLASFPGQHVIITPGMVELGKDEDKFNYDFGAHIAKKVDYAILVGPKHTAPIKKAMLEAGFDKDSVITVANLDKAGAVLKVWQNAGVIGAGDTVLYENDLPDNYNE